MSEQRIPAETTVTSPPDFVPARSPTASPAPLRDRLNELSSRIIEIAIHIHRTLGPGLLESVYRSILVYELRKRGLEVITEAPIPIVWDQVVLDCGFRADLIVEGLIVVELKSAEQIAPVHKKQLLTYLRVTDKRLGLLINFGAELLKDGVSRVVNKLDDSG